MRKTLLALVLVLPLIPAVRAQGPSSGVVRLLIGGDVNWSLRLKTPSIYNDYSGPRKGAWPPIPFLATTESRQFLERELGRNLEAPGSHHLSAIQYGLKFSSPLEEVRYPFQKIAPFLRQHNLVFVNVENPLSDGGRRVGDFRAPALFADGLRWAGISIVSIANNHALDAEGQGLMDTINTLARAGVGYAGGGRNLEDARRPRIMEANGIRIAFLAYTQHINMGPASYALPEQAGVMPMDPLLMQEDIQRVRQQVAYVAVSIHWGTETREVDPANRKFAHQLVDWGADLVLGHHSPLAKGLEVYQDKLIIYSPGHLIFGHTHEEWGDGYLVRATLAAKGIQGVEIFPIAGKGHNLSQPFLLEGSAGREVLAEVQRRSAALDTSVRIEGNQGIVTLKGR